MNMLKKVRFIPLMLTLLLVVMMVAPARAMAAVQPPVKTVELGTASSFAVLAGQAVTNTGPTTISGSVGGNVDGNVGANVGVSPGSSVTGFPPGIIKASDGKIQTVTVAKVAQDDLTKAYLDAAGRSVTTAFTSTENQLGGKTLTSGVYAFGNATTANLTAASPLILDAQGNENAVFIFQASSDLVTADGSKVELINGARFCRVFWQVTSKATLGKNSTFVGHIFALTAIVANTGATVQGQLLARNAEVTLDNNTIINGFCADITNTPVSNSSGASSGNSGTSSGNSGTSSGNSGTSSGGSGTSSGGSGTSSGGSGTSSGGSGTSISSPKTSDNSSTGIFIGVALLTIVSVVISSVFRKKVTKK